MKKIYNLAAALLVSSGLMAQRAEFATPLQGFPTVDDAAYLELVKQKRANYFTNNKEGIDKARVSHTDERVLNSGLTFGGLFQVPFLPDTIAKEKFDNTSLRGVSTHAIGGILDPTSDDFVLIDQAISRRDDYHVDSVHLGIRYTVVEPFVVDTLRFVMFYGDTLQGAANDAYYPLTYGAIPGSRVKGLKHTGSTAHGYHDGIPSSVSGRKIVDHIMSLSDTSSGVNYIAAHAGMDVPAGNVFGFIAYFIPGRAWTSSDNYRLVDQGTGLNETMNNIQTFARQEDDPDPELFAYDPSSWGITHQLGSNSRYGAWTGTDAFRNEYASPNAVAAMLVDFTYSSEDNTIGISEKNTVGAILGENYPNPFKNTTRINYSVVNNTNVQFEVTDITGKVVMSINEGYKTAGVYNLELGAEQLKSGIYYYSIITDSGKATKKMIVLE
jgi:hypothetical protein